MDNTNFNSSRTRSSSTDAMAPNPGGARSGAEPAKARGVEHPIAEDGALIGDTRHELHHKPLPKIGGPNFGYGASGTSDELRMDTGEGAKCI